MRHKATSTRNEALQKFLTGRHGVDGISVGFLGKGVVALGLMPNGSRRAMLAKCRGVGAGVSKLGSQCLYCAVYGRCFSVYAEG